MGLSAAERQAKYRKNRKEVIATLRAKIAELEGKAPPEEAHGSTMDRRLKDLEHQVGELDRRLDRIEAMAEPGY